MKAKPFYLFLGALLILFLYFSFQIHANAQSLQVIFLNIGQGDSLLIQKGTKQILIDGGPSGKKELAELGKYLPYFDREIEVMIATHPDKDHIGGLVDVARNYRIGKFFETGAEKDTAVFKELQDVVSASNIETLNIFRGMEINFEGVTMKILNPPGQVDASTGDSNNSSVVAKLSYGESSFLLTGDIEAGAEKDILDLGEYMKADVLKVAHHGSKYSSSDEFLEAVSPRDAVISAGAKNSYGHPAPETLEKLKARNVNIFRTDEMGDIIYKCKSQSEKCLPALN